MTKDILTNYVKLVVEAENRPFYASEFHLLGGDMKGLHHNGLVEPTGNVKYAPFNIGDEEKPYYITSCVKEWTVVLPKDFYKKIK